MNTCFNIFHKRCVWKRVERKEWDIVC